MYFKDFMTLELCHPLCFTLGWIPKGCVLAKVTLLPGALRTCESVPTVMFSMLGRQLFEKEMQCEVLREEKVVNIWE